MELCYGGLNRLVQTFARRVLCSVILPQRRQRFQVLISRWPLPSGGSPDFSAAIQILPARHLSVEVESELGHETVVRGTSRLAQGMMSEAGFVAVLPHRVTKTKEPTEGRVLLLSHFLSSHLSG